MYFQLQYIPFQLLSSPFQINSSAQHLRFSSLPPLVAGDPHAQDLRNNTKRRPLQHQAFHGQNSTIATVNLVLDEFATCPSGLSVVKRTITQLVAETPLPVKRLGPLHHQPGTLSDNLCFAIVSLCALSAGTASLGEPSTQTLSSPIESSWQRSPPTSRKH